ncbi:hypothetical protein [Hymenobacter jeollabukensis]|nr:hypothetical protein [Hymenobacter jeollabukensis]
MMAQAVASLVDPHSFYEHLKAGFLRETLAQPDTRSPGRPTSPPAEAAAG